MIPKHKILLSPDIGSLLGGMSSVMPGVQTKVETARVVESSAPPKEVDVNPAPAPAPTPAPVDDSQEDEGDDTVTPKVDDTEDTDGDEGEDTTDKPATPDDKSKDKISDDDFGDRLKDRGPKKTDEVKPVVKPAKPAFVRDFTGFDENEVAALKGMSNESFAKFAPILKEYKALKPQVETLKQEVLAAKNSPPAKAYFDEHGFVNEPEYLEAREQQETMTSYYNHWQEQLAQIDIDDSFLDLQLAADGKTIVTNKVQLADESQKARARAGIIGKMNTVAQYQNAASMRVNQIKQDWGGKHNQVKQIIASYEQKAFSRFVGKEQENEYTRTMLKTLGGLGQANNPLSKMLAYMYAALVEEGTKVAELTKKLEGNGVVKPAAPAANGNVPELIPSSAALASQGNGSVRRKGKDMIKDTDMLAGRFGMP